MKDLAKYAMGIVAGISVAVALGATGNGGQQDKPRSATRAKRPAVERLGTDPCEIVEGAWGAPRLLEVTCGTRSFPWSGSYPAHAALSNFAPSQGRVLGAYGRSISSLNEATEEFTFETPIYAIDESLVIPFFNPPYPGDGQSIDFEGGILFDVDGDGAKDLVSSFAWYGDGGPGEMGITPLLWIKNLAFPLSGEDSSEPRLPGDLNGDCEVSGADLGLLLDAYGNACP